MSAMTVSKSVSLAGLLRPSYRRPILFGLSTIGFADGLRSALAGAFRAYLRASDGAAPDRLT
jgi:hypothetical protein